MADFPGCTWHLGGCAGRGAGLRILEKIQRRAAADAWTESYKGERAAFLPNVIKMLSRLIRYSHQVCLKLFVRYFQIMPRLHLTLAHYVCKALMRFVMAGQKACFRRWILALLAFLSHADSESS